MAEKFATLTSIKVSGFKSLVNESEIEIRPLTILAGPNSSGKSSIMQPLLLMKQTLQAEYDPGALLLNGPHVRFTSTEQVLSKGSAERKFSVGLTTLETSRESDQINRIHTFHFHKQTGKTGFELEKMEYADDDENWSLRPHMTAEELENIPFADAIKRLNSLLPDRKFHFSVDQERFLFTLSLTMRGKDDNILLQIPRHTHTAHSLEKVLKTMLHLPGLRGNPERNYPTTAVDFQRLSFKGTFEQYTASILSEWEQTGETEKINQVKQALINLGLTNKVQTKVINDTEIAIHVGRTLNGTDEDDLVSIADVGIGVSQTLPVIVALTVAEPGQIVYIEQPEIHLHPRAQYQMAKLLADAANRRVRVIIETHSSLLLRSIQTLVAKNEITPELIKLHWFTRNPEDGITAIKSADLDQNGAFGEWPEDFDEIELMADINYLDAVENRGQE